MINSELNQKIENIQNALISIGFTKEEAKYQIEEIGEIVSKLILARLLKEQSVDTNNLTPKELKNFFKTNFQAEYINSVIQEESGKIIGSYLTQITKNLSEDKKQKFYSLIRRD